MKKEAMEIEEKQKKERRKKARARRVLIAVACLLIFLLSSLMAIPLSDHSSGILDHPLKSLMHALKRDSAPADPASGGREEKSQTVRITDPEKIDTALQLMPQLFVPEYLPEGWEMDELKVVKNMDESCSASYIFSDDSNKMTIHEVYGSGMITNLPDSIEPISLNGKNVYCFYDETKEDQAVRFFDKDIFVEINAPLEIDSLLKIADQMKPSEEKDK